jgi:hypothetical protein
MREIFINYQSSFSIERDKSVLMCGTMGYGLDDRGSRVRFPAGAGNFFLHRRVRNGSGAHPASYQWVSGTLSLGVKRPGREADHSPPPSADVKEWVELYLHSPSTPPWRGAKLNHRDNFTFTFTMEKDSEGIICGIPLALTRTTYDSQDNRCSNLSTSEYKSGALPLSKSFRRV